MKTVYRLITFIVFITVSINELFFFGRIIIAIRYFVTDVHSIQSSPEKLWSLLERILTQIKETPCVSASVGRHF